MAMTMVFLDQQTSLHTIFRRRKCWESFAGMPPFRDLWVLIMALSVISLFTGSELTGTNKIVIPSNEFGTSFKAPHTFSHAAPARQRPRVVVRFSVRCLTGGQPYVVLYLIWAKPCLMEGARYCFHPSQLQWHPFQCSSQ